MYDLTHACMFFDTLKKLITGGLWVNERFVI